MHQLDIRQTGAAYMFGVHQYILLGAVQMAVGELCFGNVAGLVAALLCWLGLQTGSNCIQALLSAIS